MPINATNKQLIKKFAEKGKISTRKAEGIFRAVGQSMGKSFTGYSGRQAGSEASVKKIVEAALKVAEEKGYKLTGYSAGRRAQRDNVVKALKTQAAAQKTSPEPKEAKARWQLSKLSDTTKEQNAFRAGKFGHEQAEYTEHTTEKEYEKKAPAVQKNEVKPRLSASPQEAREMPI